MRKPARVLFLSRPHHDFLCKETESRGYRALTGVCRYFLEVLNQYSKLMTFDVELHPDVLPIEMVVLRPDHLLDARNRTCTYC